MLRTLQQNQQHSNNPCYNPITIPDSPPCEQPKYEVPNFNFHVKNDDDADMNYANDDDQDDEDYNDEYNEDKGDDEDIAQEQEQQKGTSDDEMNEGNSAEMQEEEEQTTTNKKSKLKQKGMSTHAISKALFTFNDKQNPNNYIILDYYLFSQDKHQGVVCIYSRDLMTQIDHHQRYYTIIKALGYNARVRVADYMDEIEEQLNISHKKVAFYVWSELKLVLSNRGYTPLLGKRKGTLNL